MPIASVGTGMRFAKIPGTAVCSGWLDTNNDVKGW